MNAQRTRLSLTGYIALGIVVFVIGIVLLYAYRFYFPPI